MSLANAFGPAMAKASAKRQLVPGAVVKMFQKMDDGNEQEKWFVVVDVNQWTITCVINTNVPKLIQRNASLLKCQVPVAKADHPFMSHDSNLDCTKVMSFPTSDVLNQLAEKPEWIMGAASNALLTDMITALKITPMLTAAEASSYCSPLQKAISANSVNLSPVNSSGIAGVVSHAGSATAQSASQNPASGLKVIPPSP